MYESDVAFLFRLIKSQPVAQHYVHKPQTLYMSTRQVKKDQKVETPLTASYVAAKQRACRYPSSTRAFGNAQYACATENRR